MVIVLIEMNERDKRRIGKRGGRDREKSEKKEAESVRINGMDEMGCRTKDMDMEIARKKALKNQGKTIMNELHYERKTADCTTGSPHQSWME